MPAVPLPIVHSWPFLHWLLPRYHLLILMRPTWVEISRSALRHNFAQLRARAQSSGAELLCVVKADAYGHGLAICGPELAAAGACWLGVTSVEEGVRLREALTRKAVEQDALPTPRIAPRTVARILVMGGAWKGEAEAVIEHALTPVVWEPYQIELLEQGARRAGVAPGHLPIHIEVETGMARQGVAIAGLARLLAQLKPSTGTALLFEGLHTHYASAENHQSEQNAQQTARFCRAGLEARKADMWPRYLHGGNSSTIAAEDGTLQRLHELARGLGAHLLVRPGLALFGYLLPEQLQTGSQAAAAIAHELEPVLEWKTRVIALRDVPAGTTVGYGATWVADSARKIALLPVGYADGYSRRRQAKQTAATC